MKPSYKKSDPNQQYKRDLTTLLRMGFDAEKARKALELKDGDINEAVAYILSGGDADPTKPITNHGGKAAEPTGLVANEGVDLKPSSSSGGKGQGQVSQSSGVPWPAPNERSYYPGAVRKPTSTVSNRWRQDSGDDHPTVRAHRDPSKMYPGAVCVAGSGEPSRDEESQMATTLRDESGMTVTAEAELVQEEPDRAQLVGRIQRLEEQLQAERNQRVVADELMTDAGTSRRSEGPRENRNYKRWVVALVVCAVIAVGVAVALSLVLSSGGNDNGGDESDSFVSTPAPSPTSPPPDWGEETTMVPTSEETAVPTSEESAVPTEFSMAI